MPYATKEQIADPWPIVHLRQVARWIRHERMRGIEGVAWAPTFSIEPEHA